jgi:hypothetical protein
MPKKAVKKKRARKARSSPRKKPRRVNPPQAASSLVDFVQAQRREGCPICALPEGVREQLAEAPEKKIKLADRVKWLREVCGADVTVADVSRHLNARHDYA